MSAQQTMDSPGTPEDLLRDWNGWKAVFKQTRDGWDVEYESDHVTYTGSGPDIITALVEARVDQCICNHYYAADFNAPSLTQEQMNQIRVDLFRSHLDEAPRGEYRGSYYGR